MIPASLEGAVRRLSRAGRKPLWIFSVAPNLVGESGAVLLQCVPPGREIPARIEQPPTERWRFLVRGAQRWQSVRAPAVGEYFRRLAAQVEVASPRPAWSRAPIEAAPHVQLVVDATLVGKLMADGIARECGRGATTVLESALGAGQLLPDGDAEVHRMPKLESRGAIRACAERIILADAPWADDLAGQISSGGEIEAGTERALGVGLWWALMATGDSREGVRVPVDPEEGGRDPEEGRRDDMRWALGTGRGPW